ncbi:MAG: HAMP domain-containing histidine kinase [Candidatus Heimdallarchaeota archaeon]|nr:HAMP domain-containing histidine kinase [Candidatus Heimdallarchaeota archaeon]MCK5048878.1 HAMP domain-containing histidine kinase [Candidatus Heimdallarchaeota archaeon]
MTNWFYYLVPISYLLPFIFTVYLSVVFYKSLKQIDDKINFAFLLFIVCITESVHNLYYTIATFSRIYDEGIYDNMLEPGLWFFSQFIITIAFVFLGYKVWITPHLRLGNISDYMDEIVEKEKFYNNFLAHEIRNYNTITLNAIQLLNDEEFSNDLDLIEIANRAQLKLANLLSSITLFRDYGMEREWQIEIEEDIISVVDSFQDAVVFAKYLFEKKEVKITINADESEIVNLKGPFQTIIWNNLLSNSIKYSNGEEVKIEFEVKKINNNKIEITYSDNSKGIPEKIRKQMMKKDYKGMTSNYGLGLGVSLIKKIVNGVNGKLTIQSKVDEDYTQGTTIILILKRYVKDQ